MVQFAPAASCFSSSKACPLSADSAICSATSQESSTLLSMIPSMVRGRLPHLPSLRRSVSMYGLTARNGNASRPGTPPDENTVIILSTSRIDAVGSDIVGEVDFAEVVADDREDAAKNHWKAMDLTEQNSGIVWKFASQGLSLISLSIAESNDLSKKAETSLASPPFARQLYIHALTYLLRGLPTDITTEEGLSVRAAIPSGVIAPLGHDFHGATIHSHYDSKNLRSQTKHSQPSILHRTLATSIINLFILVQFLLPHIKVFLRTAYEYERTHRISEKVLASSIETVDGIGKISMRGGVAIWGSGLVLSVGEVVRWIVEEVSSGIQEGLGKGMARVGARKEIDLRRDKDL